MQLWPEADTICLGSREEGLRAFWKGNSANVVRIFPYSAAQLMANDYYKRLLASQARTRPASAPVHADLPTYSSSFGTRPQLESHSGSEFLSV